MKGELRNNDRNASIWIYATSIYHRNSSGSDHSTDRNHDRIKKNGHDRGCTFSRILGAMGICLFAALGVEAIRRKIPRYSEMAISIIMSTGIGLAGVLSGFVKNGTNFNSFLFGSIISISKDELLIVCVISALVLLCVLLLYKELFYIGFDENAARISGVPVKTINFIFTLLTALTVSIASRTVGTLIVSSMLVIPIACGMQVGRSYKAVMIIGVITALITTVIGLTLSYYIGLKPGGTIVLLEVGCFLILTLVSRYLK